MTLLILADDLTGAADCAARCHNAGIATSIYPHHPPTQHTDGAICLSSDSRQLSITQAAQQVRSLASQLHASRNAVWYKKIDSTLRGHIGAELDALLDTLGRSCVVICPAFPAQQRGLYYGNLVTTPAQTMPRHLPSILAHQSRRTITAINLDDVRAGSDQLAERLLAAHVAGTALLVVDALNDADLQIVLAASQIALPDALFCGSAGLIGILATHCATQLHAPTTTLPLAKLEPALFVIGSGSSMAHRQIAQLRQLPSISARELGQDTSIKISGDCLLYLPAPTLDTPLDGPAARQLAAQLADAALPLIEQYQPALLVLSGGDTAICMLDRLGIERLTVVHELQPGIPLTHGIAANGQIYAIILKAGNHGDETALVSLLASVREGGNTYEQ